MKKKKEKKEKPRIIEALEKRTGLKYYDLLLKMDILKINDTNFSKKIDCICGKEDLKYISEVFVNGEGYNIGCVCIENIKSFLCGELIEEIGEIQKNKINICIKNVDKVLSQFKEAIKNYKKNINKFKSQLNKTEKLYTTYLNEMEKSYLDLLNHEFSLVKKEIEDDTFKCGKYKGLKYYEINDNKYLLNVVKVYKSKKTDEEKKEFHKFYSVSLYNNIFKYLKRYHKKFIINNK